MCPILMVVLNSGAGLVSLVFNMLKLNESQTAFLKLPLILTYWVKKKANKFIKLFCFSLFALMYTMYDNCNVFYNADVIIL